MTLESVQGKRNKIKVRVKQKLVNFCLGEWGGYEGSADADRRHQIIITTIYLEEKTDVGDGDSGVVHDCQRHLGGDTKSSAGAHVGCREREHLQVSRWVPQPSPSPGLGDSRTTSDLLNKLRYLFSRESPTNR